jgi:hypothetical protein
MNDMLESYSEIALDILNSGYDISEKFGSTSKNPSVPDKFLVTVSRDVDTDVFIGILKILDKYGVDLIGTIMDSKRKNTIYIGSYAFRNKSSKYMKYEHKVLNDVVSGKVNPKTLWAIYSSSDKGRILQS